jgi:hypothetical protein
LKRYPIRRGRATDSHPDNEKARLALTPGVCVCKTASGLSITPLSRTFSFPVPRVYGLQKKDSIAYESGAVDHHYPFGHYAWAMRSDGWRCRMISLIYRRRRQKLSVIADHQKKKKR